MAPCVKAALVEGMVEFPAAISTLSPYTIVPSLIVTKLEFVAIVAV
jgi:hypothetical protein